MQLAPVLEHRSSRVDHSSETNRARIGNPEKKGISLTGSIASHLK